MSSARLNVVLKDSYVKIFSCAMILANNRGKKFAVISLQSLQSLVPRVGTNGKKAYSQRDCFYEAVLLLPSPRTNLVAKTLQQTCR